MWIRRHDYMEMLFAGKDDNDVIKVITGMRRCGKSTLLEMYIQELKDKGIPSENIFHLNLDTLEGQDIESYKDFNDWLTRIPQDRQTYLFIDEIQNIDQWERSVSAIYTMHLCDLYITGSNSKLLSSELSTKLSGRFVEINIFPLSFKEYLEMHPSEDVEKSFLDFLRFGSLPGIDPSRGRVYCTEFLEGVFNTVLVKDVMERNEFKSVKKLTSVARFLYSNIGNITNDSNIAKAANISQNTVDRYIRAFEQAFLFQHIEKYDIVGKKLLETNGKYYAMDLGMRNIALGSAIGTDLSKPLENAICMELLRRGYTVRIGSFRDKEVDFTATRDGVTEYYQVAWTISSEDTEKREYGSLKGIRDNWRKIVLTMDRMTAGYENGIEVRNVLDWLIHTKGTSKPSSYWRSETLFKEYNV